MIKLESVNLLLADVTWASRKSNFPTASIRANTFYLNSCARDKMFPNYDAKSHLYYNVIKYKSVFYLLISKIPQNGFYKNLINKDHTKFNLQWTLGIKNLRKEMGIPTGSQRRFKISKPKETDNPNIVAYKLTPFKEDSVKSINL